MYNIESIVFNGHFLERSIETATVKATNDIQNGLWYEIARPTSSYRQEIILRNFDLVKLFQ